VKIPNIVIIGDESQAGTYVLRIHLNADTSLRFGRFKRGKLISLPAGEYAYVGSALSEKGSTSLARRLIRHATRSGGKPPHIIREKMIHQFTECGLGSGNLLLRQGKTLHWNVDFLLDLQSAEIVNIFAIRSAERLENRISEWLERDSRTDIIEQGLGANDTPGATHLLRLRADDIGWMLLTDNAMAVQGENTLNQMNNIEN